MCLRYFVLSCELAISFSTFSSFILSGKMVIHYEFHVIFQDIEHQLQENTIHHFLHCSFFYETFIKLKSVFIQSEAFATLANHPDNLHPNIEGRTILYFYHSISCICY